MTVVDVSSIGFEVVTQVPTVPAELVEALQELSVTDIADVVGKMYTVSTGIHELLTPTCLIWERLNLPVVSS